MGDDTTTYRKYTNEEKKNWLVAQLLYFSARYTLALLVVATNCIMVIMGKTIDEKFMYLTYSIVGFYYGKSTEKKDNEKTTNN